MKTKWWVMLCAPLVVLCIGASEGKNDDGWTTSDSNPDLEERWVVSLVEEFDEDFGDRSRLEVRLRRWTRYLGRERLSDRPRLDIKCHPGMATLTLADRRFSTISHEIQYDTLYENAETAEKTQTTGIIDWSGYSELGVTDVDRQALSLLASSKRVVYRSSIGSKPKVEFILTESSREQYRRFLTKCFD